MSPRCRFNFSPLFHLFHQTLPIPCSPLLPENNQKLNTKKNKNVRQMKWKYIGKCTPMNLRKLRKTRSVTKVFRRRVREREKEGALFRMCTWACICELSIVYTDGTSQNIVFASKKELISVVLLLLLFCLLLIRREINCDSKIHLKAFARIFRTIRLLATNIPH